MKVVSIAAVLCLAPAVAFSADLPGRKSPAAVQQAPVFTWNGAYAGLNGGWGFGKVTDPYVTPALGSIKTDGVLGGVQIGYNHLINNILLGLEADYDLANINGKISRSVNNVDIGNYKVTGSGSISSTLQSLGTLRIRTGYVMNSAMFYATGGLAYGSNKIKASGNGNYVNNGVTKVLTDAGSDTKTMTGWALGAGVEYAFTANISGKLEYIHADLGKKSVFAGTWAETKIANKVDIVRIGLNYRF